MSKQASNCAALLGFAAGFKKLGEAFSLEQQQQEDVDFSKNFRRKKERKKKEEERKKEIE